LKKRQKWVGTHSAYEVPRVGGPVDDQRDRKKQEGRGGRSTQALVVASDAEVAFSRALCPGTHDVAPDVGEVFDLAIGNDVSRRAVHLGVRLEVHSPARGIERRFLELG